MSDALSRYLQQRCVVIGMLGRCVGPVQEQREMQLAMRGGKVVNFESFEKCFDGLARGQQRRHHDHGSHACRNAGTQRQRR